MLIEARCGSRNLVHVGYPIRGRDVNGFRLKFAGLLSTAGTHGTRRPPTVHPQDIPRSRRIGPAAGGPSGGDGDAYRGDAGAPRRCGLGARVEVEMAGIEPASEEIAHGYATGLVGLAKLLARILLTRPSRDPRQPMVFRYGIGVTVAARRLHDARPRCAGGTPGEHAALFRQRVRAEARQFSCGPVLRV